MSENKFDKNYNRKKNEFKNKEKVKTEKTNESILQTFSSNTHSAAKQYQY